MPIVKHILSFASGEISPLLDGRTDIAKYAGACKRLENFIPTPQGGLLKRPGLQHLGHVPNSEAPDWKTGEGYEAGDRVSHLDKTWIARFGHNPAGGNAPGLGAKMTDPYDGVKKEIWRIHPDTFGRLVEFQVTTHRSVVLAMGGKRMKFVDRGRMLKTSIATGAPDFKVAIPWRDEDLRLLRWKQVNNVMFFCHPAYPPYQLIRRKVRVWELEKIDFGLDVPLLDENPRRARKITTKFNEVVTLDPWSDTANYEAGDLVTRSGKTWVAQVDHTDPHTPGGSDTFKDPGDGVNKKVWVESYDGTSSEVEQRITLECNAEIFNEGHVGSVWEIAARRPESKYEVTRPADNEVGTDVYSPVLIVQGAWDFITFGTWHGVFTIEISTDKGESWSNERQFRSELSAPRNASAEGYEDKRVLIRIKFRKNAVNPTGDIQPHARLSARDGRIRGLVRITQYVGPQEVKGRCLSPVEKTTTSVWREGAWSTYQGFPRCVELHQNRLLFAGTDRRPHSIWGSAVDDYLNFKRGTDADESYAHTLAIGTRDPILWMDSNRTLVVGNGGGEFTLRGENADSPVTPEFGICDRHSSFGTQQGGVGHIVSDTVSLFVQNGGRALREMAYSFQSDKYESANLNLLAEHLFKGAITDVAVQRQPFQIIWVVAGGQLFSMTYERSQEVVAWARHSVGGEVIAICGVRRSAEDGMHFLIRRGTQLAIERFTPGGILAPKDDGSFLDSHVTLTDGSGSYKGVYDFSKHPLRGQRVCGLWHGKNGKGGKAISVRKLNAEFFQGLTGPVTVGLPFRAVCQPVTPEMQLENGSSRSRECRIHKIVPNVHRSRGGKFGETPDGPLDPLGIGSSGHLYSGEVEREFDGGFGTNGDFCIISDDPHPFTIRSVALKLNYTGDVR